MLFCPQCGRTVDDGGYPEAQSLECGFCGCSFYVNALGSRSHVKVPPAQQRLSCGQIVSIVLGVLFLLGCMLAMWLIRVP